MAHGLQADALLALWERTLGLQASARDDALLQTMPEPEAVSTLGERNVRLLRLHAQLFGNELLLLSHCPGCRTVVQFSADCELLAARGSSASMAVAPLRLETQGYCVEFRLPDAADIAAASGTADDDEFAAELLDRCVLGCWQGALQFRARELPMPVLEALSQLMDALDPAASVSFTLSCPACSEQWDARLDVGQLVWQKIRAAAECVLLDVDALARAYGWTEAEVLRLSPARRAAYLQLVAA